MRCRRVNIRDARSLFTRRFPSFINRHFHSDPPLSSSSPSPNLSGLAESVISKCPLLVDPGKFKASADSSLQCLLFEILDVIPSTARRFLRSSKLKPQDVLQIVVEFQRECEKSGFRGAKIGCLWKIFSMEFSEGFKELPRACEAMASILTRVGMLREAEILLSQMESEGLELGNAEIYSNLIEGYVGIGQLSSAIAVYEKMSRRGLVATPSCYHVFINFLVRKKKIKLAFSVCLDMVEMRVELSGESETCIDNVIRLLCTSCKMYEVRNLLKKVSPLGWEPSSIVLNDIVRGYCEKKDFKDLLSLYREFRWEPDTCCGNWIMHALCKSFGSQEADRFRLELEHLGFIADEITFGILICWSCHEGNLKMAFLYLSEILARGLKPGTFSYNALICGVFKERLWKHARNVLDEMLDKGTLPDMSTFRILLAGYCDARQFDEVRTVILEMSKLDLIQLNPSEDPVSKAFAILGFDPLAVRLKRDNDTVLSQTQFYDTIGNGLYLDTDLDEFDRRINQVLEYLVIPDFNSLIMEECGHGNLKCALRLAHEMHHWGQDLSSSVLSTLIKGLCASRCSISEVNLLMERIPNSFCQLDEEALNQVVQFCLKKGLSQRGRSVVEVLSDNSLMFTNETYTALITGLCKRGDLRVLRSLWDLAWKKKWIPGLEEVKPLLNCLLQKRLLHEAINLLERMLVAYPSYNAHDVIFEKLCASGLSTTADLLAREIHHRGCVLDHAVHCHLIRGFCLEKKYFEAVRVFDTMHLHSLVLDPDVLILLIPSLCITGRFKEAIMVRDILLTKHISFSSAAQSALLKGYVRSGKNHEAASLIWDLLSKGIYPGSEAYDTVVRAICQLNMCKAEELLAFVIRRKSISISNFRNIVQFLCRESSHAHAMNLKEFMLGESNNSDALIIYNILIFYIFSSGQSFVVNKLLDEMLEKNLPPDEFTYNFLISGFSRSKDASSSFKYLHCMISKKLRPGIRSLRNIISCLLNNAEFGKVRNMCEEMEPRCWLSNSTIQNIIIYGLVSHGKVQEAERFLDQLVANHLVLDGVIYDCVIKHLCQQGRMTKVIDLLDIMLKRGSVPDPSCYESLLHGFCNSNELDQALDFYAEVSLRGFRLSTGTMAMLVNKCCECGKTVEVEGLLDSMASVGVSPTREMYSSIIKRYQFDNNPEKASELMQAMQKIGYELDFEIHWSLISTLNKLKDGQDDDNSNQGFLSSLLSGSGFSWRKIAK